MCYDRWYFYERVSVLKANYLPAILLTLIYGISLSSCVMLGGVSKSQTSLGSGFVVNTEGFIVTAYHVVKNKNNIYVKFSKSNRWLPATLYKKDELSDLALLQIPIRTTPLKISDWSNVPVGLEVYAIGYPLPAIEGSSIKISQGIINSDVGMHGSVHTFQFNAGVQKGLSGGPVISPDGLLIGMVQAKLNELEVAKRVGDLPQSVNYGIKSSYILQFLRASSLIVDSSQLNLAERKRPYEIMAGNLNTVVAIRASELASK